jgi:hypothetical protein
MSGSYDAHKNFAIGTIVTAPSPATSGTTLVVTSGHAARFPTTPFNATIWPGDVHADPSNAEIVRVTDVNVGTNTLTITRAQEGTTARTVVANDIITAPITAKTVSDIEDTMPVPMSELIALGHSLSTGFGGSGAEFSWPHRWGKS